MTRHLPPKPFQPSIFERKDFTMIDLQHPMPEPSKHAAAFPVGWPLSKCIVISIMFLVFFPLSLLIVIGWFVLKWAVGARAVHAHQAVAKQDQPAARAGQATEAEQNALSDGGF
jgi:hypothetical protein